MSLLFVYSRCILKVVGDVALTPNARSKLYCIPYSEENGADKGNKTLKPSLQVEGRITLGTRKLRVNRNMPQAPR